MKRILTLAFITVIAVITSTSINALSDKLIQVQNTLDDSCPISFGNGNIVTKLVLSEGNILDKQINYYDLPYDNKNSITKENRKEFHDDFVASRSYFDHYARLCRRFRLRSVVTACNRTGEEMFREVFYTT